jgi:signal transduction histidine kinase
MSAGRSAPRRAQLPAHLSVGQVLGVTIGLLLLLATGSVGGALVASDAVTHQRAVLLDKVGPSQRAELQLATALVNQETGVRGYIISHNRSFLEPLHEGQTLEAETYRTLQSDDGALGGDVSAEIAATHQRIASWKTEYVVPELKRVLRGQLRNPVSALGGKSLFDAVRLSLASLQSTLSNKEANARSKLNGAATVLNTLLIVALCLVVGSILAAGYVLRRRITRPLAVLGEASGRVAAGEFDAALPQINGPREIAALSKQTEAMRTRIVRELELLRMGQARLEAQAAELARSNSELARSNSELEQFAYVASHDLQEPLRKIASFCQALQTRYRGQLDERADQYIDFAVDGAKRMQVLINDLLAFSRVGRQALVHVAVDLREAAAGAGSSLADMIEETGAHVSVRELPIVTGDEALLRSLFQNLIANALKFCGAEAPEVTISAERDGDGWLISCEDNGIGVDAEYAERIFLIFQRLHTREAYDGSGIGLALCRKIVEYHGGRIWLDTHHSGGARFCFTLPAGEETSS